MFGNFFDPVSSVYVACESVSVKDWNIRNATVALSVQLVQKLHPTLDVDRQLCNPRPPVHPSQIAFAQS